MGMYKYVRAAWKQPHENPEHQARLFEMFYRATEGAGGFGLGLYLVKKIVESLKGTISIDSEFGQWTKVEVKLPVSH